MGNWTDGKAARSGLRNGDVVPERSQPETQLTSFVGHTLWNRDQVRGLMQSLYRKHPVGSLLVWETRTENAWARGDGPLAAGTVKLLLDGQQRITSLYGLIRARPPRSCTDPRRPPGPG